jgi:hypothetical protein
MLVCLFTVMFGDHQGFYWAGSCVSNNQNVNLTAHLDSLLSVTTIFLYGMVIKHKKIHIIYIT